MPLDVNGQLIPSSPSLPQTGGVVTVTFQARSIPSPSRLRANYSMPSGSTFRIVGSSTLGPSAVGTGTFSQFPKQLDIRPMPGIPPGPPVIIDASVQEIDSGGQPIGAPRPARCILSVQSAFAAISPQAAGAPLVLGQRLRSFRTEAGMSQAEIARQLGISRSTISRIERGQEPSDRIADAIQAMIRRN